jgi:hypothetical protein
MNNTLFIFNHLHLRILQDLIFNKKLFGHQVPKIIVYLYPLKVLKVI